MSIKRCPRSLLRGQDALAAAETPDAGEREGLSVVKLTPIEVGERVALGIEVDLPKTHLAIIATQRGYIMCGALDVELLNRRLADRRIIAGRAVGVKTLDDLLGSPLESVTDAARELGIVVGMTGREAVARMF